jgi:hypothetical protein
MNVLAITREVRATSASLEGWDRGTSFEARKSAAQLRRRAHLRMTAVVVVEAEAG